MPQAGGTRGLLSVLGADKARCPTRFLHGQSISFPHPSLDLISQMNHRNHLVFSLTEQPGHCVAVIHKYSVIPSCPQPGAAQWSHYKSAWLPHWRAESLTLP